jgi:hypothetical protein
MLENKNPFSAETQLLLDVVQFAHSRIDEIKNEHPSITQLAMPIKASLFNHISRLYFNIYGTPIDPTGTSYDEKKPVEATPLKSFLGRDLKAERNAEPNKVEIDEMRRDVDNLFEIFLDETNDDLLDNKFPEIIIRGVAKKAGLVHYTETHPRKITEVEIKEIKTAILRLKRATSNESRKVGNYLQVNNES